MSDEAGDLFDADPWWLIKLTSVVRSWRGVRSLPMPASVQSRFRHVWSDRSVLVSPCPCPWTDRQTATCGGTGGLAAGSPSNRHASSAGRGLPQCGSRPAG
jgi:hypothetical protein